MSESLIPVQDVAKALETTELSVLMHVKRGILKGEEVEGKWFITRESLEAHLNSGDVKNTGSLCKSSCSSASGCGTCA